MSNPSPELKSFHNLVLRLDHGAINDQLSESVRKCVKEVADACLDRGGKHKATLSVKFDFVMDQRDRVIEVYTTIDEKLPKEPSKRAGLYFCDEDGNLLRENPRQLTIEDEIERQRQKRLEDAERTAGV